MSTIHPQTASNGQSSPLIVISTVHGLAITVPIDLLAGINGARVSGDLPKTGSTPKNR